MLHYLSGIDSREKLIRSPRVGQNFESFVIEEIIKGVQASKTTHLELLLFQDKARGRSGSDLGRQIRYAAN